MLCCIVKYVKVSPDSYRGLNGLGNMSGLDIRFLFLSFFLPVAVYNEEKQDMVPASTSTIWLPIAPHAMSEGS